MTRNTSNQLDVGFYSYSYGLESPSNGDWAFYLWANASGYGINSGWYPINGDPAVGNYLSLGTFGASPDYSMWHDVKVTLTDSLVGFYLDNSLLAEYDVGQVIPVPIEDYHLVWMTWGQRDLDNITVSPIPAPDTLALLAIGLTGLGFSRYKKA